MRNINILVNDDHTVNFDNDYAGLNRENLQGNIVFSFKNFVDGQARAEIVIDNQDGYILLDKVDNTYVLPIKSSLLTGSDILMQLVIDEPQAGEEYPIWKSEAFLLKVGYSINAETPIPEDYPSWIEILDGLRTEVEDATEKALNVNIESEQLTNGVKVTTTNQNGEETTTIVPQGPQGEIGPQGPTGPQGPQGIQGIQGPIGPQGEAFTIKKTYPSIAAMNADFNNMQLGDYVMIANGVEQEDNAKLYTRGETQWIFICDFSGATGIQGEQGPQGPQGIQGEQGIQGIQGETGPAGNGISNIEVLSTTSSQTNYRINFTNGTYFDYSVQNGEVTQTQLDEVIEENDYLNSIIDQIVPKTTGTGTSITLDNTIQAKMNMSLAPTELSQDATPTPDTPQDIHTISGNNSVVVEGKNKLDISNVNSTNAVDYSISNNKLVITSTSANANCYLSYKITNLQPSTQYTISGSVVADNTQNISIRNYKIGGGYSTILTINKATINDTFTTTSDVSYIAIFLYSGTNSSSGSVGDKTTFTNLMVSTIGGEYEPYISQTAPINLPVENLFNGTIEYEGKVISDTGSFSTNANYNVYRISNLKGNTTYTVSENQTATLSGSTAIRGVAYNLNDEVLGMVFYQDRSSVKRYTYTFTTPANTSYILAQFRITDTDLQLEKGTKANSYTPYGTTPYNLGSIGNYENKFIRSGGENSFNSSFETKTTSNITFSYDSGIITLNNTTASTTGTIILNDTLNDTLPKGTYTCIFQYISGTASGGNSRVSIGDSNVGIATDNEHRYFSFAISSGNTSNMVQTITINEDKTINKWGFYVNSGITYTNYKFRLYIVKGTYATSNIPDYVPYEKGWYYKEGIGKVVLDGSESWTYTDSIFQCPYQLQKYVGSTITSICDYFAGGYNKQTTSTYYNGNNNNTIGFAPTKIFVRDDSITSAENFQTWLSTHNITLYYVLSTPTYTQITGTLETQLNNIYKNMLSYKGQTNVSQVNNDLPFVISSSAYTELN